MKTPSGRSVRMGVASAALLGVSAVSVLGLASTALFTDSRTTGAAAVASGSVALNVGGTASTALAATALAPGDAKYAVVTVTDAGSLALRYSGAVSWSVSNALTQSVQLSIRSVPSPAATCDASLTWGTGDLASNVTAPSTTAALFGSAVTGQQAGDRLLAAATSESFCVREVLPATATNSVANLTATLTLQFDAEQTANN
jgi:hypothetical protein